MFPIEFPIVDFSLPIMWGLAIFGGIFLFWRAGRHELLDSELLFDSLVVGLVGAFVGGRILEFIVNYEKFGWSLARLVFFNVYGGFDFWGALIGAFVAQAIFHSKTKINIWSIFDLAAAPLVFAQSLISLGNFFSGFEQLWLYYFTGYLAIFWLLKRLARRKHHVGFFACFYLVSTASLDLILFNFKKNYLKLFAIYPYEVVAAFAVLFFGIISWYILARRNPKNDLKSFSGFVLLASFKVIRALKNVREANEISKLIIFSPYYLLRLFLYLFTRLLQEFVGGISDFMNALGVRK